MSKAIGDFRQRAKERKKRWGELTILAEQKEVKEFYLKYAEYLKWEGIISKDRLTLYNMSVAVNELIQ